MINSFENEIKEKWGNTKAYTEFTEKTKDYSKDRFAEVNAGLENIFHDFAALLQSGIPVLTYSKELEQIKSLVTDEFIEECKKQLMKDFYGENVF